MRAAAHGDDANLVAIFFAEQGAGAGLDRLIDVHQARGDGGVFQDHAIGDLLDLRQFLVRDGFGMGEIEAQTIGRDQRAFLRDMVAENLAQSLVKQMRGGMIGADGGAALVIDVEFERHAELDLAVLDHDLVDEQIADFLDRVFDAKAGFA